MKKLILTKSKVIADNKHYPELEDLNKYELNFGLNYTDDEVLEIVQNTKNYVKKEVERRIEIINDEFDKGDEFDKEIEYLKDIQEKINDKLDMIL